MQISKQQKQHVVIVLIAAIASFLIQDVNVLNGFSSKCSLYQFNTNCATFTAFAVNKLLRLLVLLGILFYADIKLLKALSGKIFKGIVFAAILLYGVDMLLSAYGGVFSLKMHHLLNTILYSPLLVIVYIITFAQSKFL